MLPKPIYISAQFPRSRLGVAQRNPTPPWFSPPVKLTGGWVAPNLLLLMD
ncbi:hypothetical protein NIES39_D06920 [Arthrospira platensis NIES-39]|nr:hypothetical protein NIES39_D06920 [Arthrospira platensis NIES-39]